MHIVMFHWVLPFETLSPFLVFKTLKMKAVYFSETSKYLSVDRTHRCGNSNRPQCKLSFQSKRQNFKLEQIEMQKNVSVVQIGLVTDQFVVWTITWISLICLCFYLSNYATSACHLLFTNKVFSKHSVNIS